MKMPFLWQLHLLVCCCCGLVGCTLSVRKPPSIIKGPVREAIFRDADKVTLECQGEGVPELEYEWKKNGFDMNLNLQNIERGEHGTIIINQASSMDEGFYQCFARNQYGTALSVKAHLQRALLEQSAGASVHNKTVKEGESFHIQADPRRSFPKPTFGWDIAQDAIDKNPHALTLSRRIQIADNGDLHFAYARTDDALQGRIYKCTTYNQNLDLKSGGSYTKITVERANATGFKPTISFSSAPQTVAVIGKPVSLRCFFSGNPEPELSWKGPRNTWSSERYKKEKFNSELKISEIMSTDQGDFVCTAENSQGRNEHTLRLRVEAIPVFKTEADGPHDVIITEGESVTFNCSPEAIPEAKIEWFQNGNPLDVNHSPRRFAFSSNGKSLTIKDLCLNCFDRESGNDLTVIQCNASNIHGYAFGSGYLNVLRKTKVLPSGTSKYSVGENEGKKFEFECNATSDPSTPPTVIWYKKEGDNLQMVHEEQNFVRIRNGTLIIEVVAPNGTKLWTKYSGEYHCVANNGYSKDSQIVILRVEGNSSSTMAQQGGIADWWWLFLVIGIVMLLLIIILCCCIYLQRNKGDKYDVDEHEKRNGIDASKELSDADFHEYQRRESLKAKGSQGSLSSLLKVDEEFNPDDSLGKFTEDGSFVGTYRSKDRMDAALVF